MSRSDYCTTETLIVFLSVILGAVIAALFYFNILPLFLTVVWVAFATAAAVLLLLPFLLQNGCFHYCMRSFGNPLLVGAAGTILSSLAALSVPLVSRSVAVAILVFLVASFFLYLFSNILAFIGCQLERTF